MPTRSPRDVGPSLPGTGGSSGLGASGGVAVGSRSSGGGLSGKIGYDLYKNVESLHLSWLNDIDDFVSPDEQMLIKSPYATFGAAYAITQITKANPAVVTCTGHPFENGDKVLLVGTGSYRTAQVDTSADETYIPQKGTLDGHVFVVRGKDTNTFQLEGVNTTSFQGATYASTQGWALEVTVKTGYDPSTEIAAIETELSGYDTAVGNLDPVGSTGDYYDAVTRAVALASSIFSTSYVEDVVSNYESMVRDKFRTKIMAFMGGMSDINSVNTTGYVMGLAVIESDIRKEVNDFKAKLLLQIDQNRTNAIFNGIESMLGLVKFKVEEQKALVHMTGEVNRLKINANTAEDDLNRSLALKNDMWPMDRYQYGANMLAAILGAVGDTASDKEPESGGVAGAFGGMSVGSMVGASIVGAASITGPAAPLVIGAGALVGAIAGYNM